MKKIFAFLFAMGLGVCSASSFPALGCPTTLGSGDFVNIALVGGQTVGGQLPVSGRQSFGFALCNGVTYEVFVTVLGSDFIIDIV
jgi:hypothetical protein